MHVSRFSGLNILIWLEKINVYGDHHLDVLLQLDAHHHLGAHRRLEDGMRDEEPGNVGPHVALGSVELALEQNVVAHGSGEPHVVHDSAEHTLGQRAVVAHGSEGHILVQYAAAAPDSEGHALGQRAVVARGNVERFLQ